MGIYLAMKPRAEFKPACPALAWYLVLLSFIHWWRREGERERETDGKDVDVAVILYHQ